MLSDEQMRKIWQFSLLNDEQMSNKVVVKHQPVIGFLYPSFSPDFLERGRVTVRVPRWCFPTKCLIFFDFKRNTGDQLEMESNLSWNIFQIQVEMHQL